jgi:hypothetical protein
VKEKSVSCADAAAALGLAAMGSQIWDGLRKRKHSSLSISDLEGQIAKLRRQEATVARHLARLGHQAAPPSVTPAHLPETRLTPYELRVAQIRENQSLRLKSYWNDVRKEIRKLLKMSLVTQWFGIPVKDSAWGQDPKNWERYCAKIKCPMDLSTIRDQLGENEASNLYTHPEQVARDVRLIVSNCEQFNVGDTGENVRKVSRTLQATWERRWQPEDSTGLAFRWKELIDKQNAETEVR